MVSEVLFICLKVKKKKKKYNHYDDKKSFTTTIPVIELSARVSVNRRID